MSGPKKNVDIGSKMTFGRINRGDYSLEDQKPKDQAWNNDEIVKLSIDDLEDSPKEWNFYPPLSQEEFFNLVNSIIEHGLLHPIVVRQESSKKTILSGHNRVEAYKHIRKTLEELEKNGDEAKREDGISLKSKDFHQIFAILKKDITDEAAREIIIDANYVQRQLGPRLISRSVVEKYKLIQTRRKEENLLEYKNRKTRDIVAESFGLSGRHIERYKKLEKLNDTLQQSFYQGKLSLELASRLADLSGKVQDLISEKYLNIVQNNPSRIMQYLKPSLTKKDFSGIIEEVAQDKEAYKVSLIHNNRRKVIAVKDPNQMAKLLAFLEEEGFLQETNLQEEN